MTMCATTASIQIASFPILSTPLLFSGKRTLVFTFSSLSPATTDTFTETLPRNSFPVDVPSVHWIGAVGVRKWPFSSSIFVQ